MSLDSQPTIRRQGAVAVIVRDGRLLTIRRSQLVVAPGMVCFPGGGLEPGETDEVALVREINEELGVIIQPLGRLWHSITPWGVELFWWQAELAAEAVLRINPAEVAEAMWHTPAELVRLPDLLDSNRDFLGALERGQIQFQAAERGLSNIDGQL